MAVAAAFCIWLARRQPGRPTVFVERVLALVILAAWAGEYIYDGVLGTWKVDEDLPLQLTDAVSIVSVVALWTRRPRLVELCYLLGMTAALQAVLTPDLQQSFPSPYYFTYFIYHCGAVVAACLLVFGERHPLRPGAARRVYLTTLAWMGIAELANLTLAGANYMYLRVSPGHASLLSVFGGWPWYVLGGTIVIAPLLLAFACGLAALVERWDRSRDVPWLVAAG